MKRKTTPQGAAEPAGERSLEELRASVMRKLAAVLEYPQSCRDMRCRRARRCVRPDFACLDSAPALTPEEEAAGEERLAQLQAALRRSVQ